ncbi:MAG: type I DNA topoisomerase [Cyanobacteria bacterium J06649_5]
MSKLLLIESPGKIKKLSQILGPSWTVKASMGHIRELTNEGEDSLGFDMDGTEIRCKYAPRDIRAKKTISSLRQAVKQADTVYIATDPDREGETIGWHLQQALRLKKPYRVVYSEITPAAVRKAIANPSVLDQSLVAAGRARDCLDKLVGYKGSRHVVWPLNNGAKSMGRVQSATLHLLCQREREILKFTPQDYWSVWVSYAEGFKAFYKRSPTAGRPKKGDKKDTEKGTGDSKKGPESERVSTQAEANRLVNIAQSAPHKILSVEGKLKTQAPPPPFITSTLQQSAGSKLRFSPEQTMKVAQSLYEAGHITYMRTDSVVLSAPFMAAVKDYLTQHDPTNVPKKTAKQRTAKGAQAAHEAIRPTDVTLTPQQIRANLSADAIKLYELIWNRAVASQCCSAKLRKTRIVTQAGEGKETTYWEARGQVVAFAGYTRYWNNLSADSQLPTLQPEQTVVVEKAQADKKQTQPPPRYSEPKLVQLMERKGIGRPSTYAPTIKTLRSRTYVGLLKGKLQPTELGLSLDTALEKLLPDLIQPEFTAQMEAELDAIASGKQEWQTYLTGWHKEYFGPAIASAKTQLSAGIMQELRKSAADFAAAKSRNSRATKSTTPKVTQKSKKKSASKQSAQAAPTSGAPYDFFADTHSVPVRSTKGTGKKEQKSKTKCPKCDQLLNKIPSKSKKLKANHFLKCGDPLCDTVMFWNAKQKTYELPYAQREADPAAFTNHPCPVCNALLIRHAYKKEGIDKVMLRCSILENRKCKCKDVAFFQSRDGGFWSPKFGTLDDAKQKRQPPKADVSSERTVTQKPNIQPPKLQKRKRKNTEKPTAAKHLRQ